jgi:hypothetical protein
VAFNVIVEVLDVELDMVAGEKVAVTPAGRPEAERVALPVNPYSELNEMVEVTVLSGFNSNAMGALERVNVGC